MSKFDWRTFVGGVASGVASDIRQRRLDARAYEDEQEDLAERNISTVKKRELLANQAAQLGHRARALGATDAQIQNALNSGMNGIADFYNKLQATVEEKGVKTLGKADIDAIVNMPNIPDVDFEFADGELAEQTRQLYGFSNAELPERKRNDSLVGKIFGFDAKDRARDRLRDRKLYGGLSVAEINNIARQGEYESLMGNATMTFTDVNFFGKKDLRTFTRDLNSAMSSAVKDPIKKLDIENAGKVESNRYQSTDRSAPNYKSDEERLQLVAQAEREKATLVKQEAAKLVIENALDTYLLSDLLSNEAFKRMVETTMGPTYLAEILAEAEELDENLAEENLPLPPEPTSTATSDANEAAAATFETPEGGTDDSQAEGNEEGEGSEEEAPDPEAQKEALLNKTFPKRPSGLSAKKVGWDRDYKGKVNPDTGKVIIAPPRPADGGEKTKSMRNENVFGVRQGKDIMLTEAEYWDRMYGETHDPRTGLPFGAETLLED